MPAVLECWGAPAGVAAGDRVAGAKGNHMSSRPLPARRPGLDWVSATIYIIAFWALGLALCAQVDLFSQL
jgi:hypothetical protein